MPAAHVVCEPVSLDLENLKFYILLNGIFNHKARSTFQWQKLLSCVVELLFQHFHDFGFSLYIFSSRCKSNTYLREKG